MKAYSQKYKTLNITFQQKGSADTQRHENRNKSAKGGMSLERKRNNFNSAYLFLTPPVLFPNGRPFPL
jgi:hypothetical protein